MIDLESITPLFFLPFLILVAVYLSRRSSSTLSKTWLRLLIISRIGLIFFFVCALCGPSLNFSADKERLVVFLLDVSESVTDQAKRNAIDFIQSFKSEKSALVVFAGECKLVRGPQRSPISLTNEEIEYILYRNSLVNLESGPRVEAILKWKDLVDARKTDPVKGVLFSRMLFQDGYDNKILLMTDGNFETKLDSNTFLYPLDIISPEIITSLVDIASVTNYGKSIDAIVCLVSNIETSAQIKISIDNVLIPEYTQNVQIKRGENRFSVKNIDRKDLLSRGNHTISALVSAEKDTEKKNNYAVSTVQIIGRQNAIVFKNHSEDISNLEKIISAQDIQVNVEDFRKLPQAKDEFSNYDLVIFSGLPETEVMQQIHNELRSYINDRGGGFILCASRSMLNLKLQESLLQKILPVVFSNEQIKPAIDGTPTKVQAPQITMLFLIDKSGSMAGKNLSIAKESCIESAKVLSDNDYLSVIAFDAKAHLVVKPTKASEIKEIEDRVLKLFADGGTDIYQGLSLARKTLGSIKTSIKHIVLLSDGITNPGKFDEIIQEMVSDGITISTVCLGTEEFDVVVMDQIAKAGKGRMMFASSFNKIPQIFINETKHIISTTKKDVKQVNGQNDVQTGISSKLAIKDMHEILKGVDMKNISQINGYIRAKKKDLAFSVIETEDKSPLISIWHYGLGKTAFFASEIGTSWSLDFFKWDGGAKLFTQLLRFTSSISKENLYSRIYITREFDKVLLRIEGIESEKVDIKLEPEGKIDSYRYKNDLYSEFRMTRPEIQYKVQIKTSGQTANFASVLSYEPELAKIGKNIDFFEQNKDKIDLPIDMEKEVKVPLKTAFAIIALFFVAISVFLRRYTL